MRTYNLSSALIRCRRGAAKGYEIADIRLGEIEKVLGEARDRTEASVKELGGKKAKLSELNKQLSSQLKQISKTFDKVSVKSREELKALRDNLSKFTVVLFGRTMTGKSTLMEILTHGDGKSIGNGSQRTTRDIRSYEWNGLCITDVPGIGAYEGQKDEDEAYKAAKTADLILFLMSDDGVQSQEAEWFRTVRELGKPVLCVINVKASVDINDDPAFITEEIDDAFDIERLGEIRAQFVKYGALAGQDWNGVPFVYTHLRSAFLAQQTDDPEKRRLLERASGIDSLTDALAGIIAENGEFYRAKAYIDAVSRPVENVAGLLLEQCLANSLQAEIIADKQRKLCAWITEFEKSAYERAESFIADCRSTLYSGAGDFAAEHISDKNSADAWKAFIKSQGLDARAKELIDDLTAQANGEIREITRSLSSELKFAVSFASEETLRGKRILDVKRTVDWASILLGGGFAVAGTILLPIVPPLGIIFTLVSFGIGGVRMLADRFLPTKDSLEASAKGELEEKLRRNVNANCDRLRDSIEKSLRELFGNLRSLEAETGEIGGVVSALSLTQYTLAQKLSRSLRELNRGLVREALALQGCPELSLRIEDVGVIPGAECCLILVPGASLPSDALKKLASILGVTVRAVTGGCSSEELIKRLLGENAVRLKRLSGGVPSAELLTDKSSPSAVNKAKLAQQLCEIIITK